MRARNLLIPGIIFLVAIQVIQAAFPAPGKANSSKNLFLVELTDLKKRGDCDSTKYKITKIDSANTINTHQSFSDSAGEKVYEFTSSLEPGETHTYDLADMDDLSQYFWAIVTVTSVGEITGEVLPSPVCWVTTEGPLVVEVNKTYTFTGTAHPPEAQLPITYIW
jgi:hypothetical protein